MVSNMSHAGGPSIVGLRINMNIYDLSSVARLAARSNLCAHPPWWLSCTMGRSLGMSGKSLSWCWALTLLHLAVQWPTAAAGCGRRTRPTAARWWRCRWGGLRFRYRDEKQQMSKHASASHAALFCVTFALQQVAAAVAVVVREAVQLQVSHSFGAWWPRLPHGVGAVLRAASSAKHAAPGWSPESV